MIAVARIPITGDPRIVGETISCEWAPGAGAPILDGVHYRWCERGPPPFLGHLDDCDLSPYEGDELIQ